MDEEFRNARELALFCVISYTREIYLQAHLSNDRRVAVLRSTLDVHALYFSRASSQMWGPKSRPCTSALRTRPCMTFEMERAIASWNGQRLIRKVAALLEPSVRQQPAPPPPPYCAPRAHSKVAMRCSYRTTGHACPGLRCSANQTAVHDELSLEQQPQASSDPSSQSRAKLGSLMEIFSRPSTSDSNVQVQQHGQRQITRTRIGRRVQRLKPSGPFLGVLGSPQVSPASVSDRGPDWWDCPLCTNVISVTCPAYTSRKR